MSLQEKFQIITPYREKETEQWASAKSARTGEGACCAKNKMPSGMQIDADTPSALVMSGESDVSADTNAEAFEKGYTRRHLDGCDDQYTGEHVDLFYGEAVDEAGNAGFVERNNYMDRL